MKKLLFALHDLRTDFAPPPPQRWPRLVATSTRGLQPASRQPAAPERAAISCATASVPIFTTPPAVTVLPKRRRDVANLRADRRGNTTLELISRWLRKQP